MFPFYLFPTKRKASTCGLRAPSRRPSARFHSIYFLLRGKTTGDLVKETPTFPCFHSIYFLLRGKLSLKKRYRDRCRFHSIYFLLRGKLFQNGRTLQSSEFPFYLFPTKRKRRRLPHPSRPSASAVSILFISY